MIRATIRTRHGATWTEDIYSVDDIRRAMDRAGSHWWDADTMRFFGTRAGSRLYTGPGGAYFVTSEQPPHGPRAYTVRRFVAETCSIETVGDFGGYATRAAAHRAARTAAKGDA